LDQLHDGLEPNDVEVWIEVSDHYVAWCPCVGCFRSSDRWVFARTVVRSRSIGTHHANSASLGGKVPVDAASNLEVIFD
jgi:hypothetical protein